MKKLILIMLLLLMFTTSADAYTAAEYLRSGANLGSKSKLLDPMYLHMIHAAATYGGTELGTGDIFYVDADATGEADGTSWIDAVTTVQASTALTAANNGDMVLIAPGHAETISGAKAIDLDIAGVTYIGVGVGADMAKFTYDTNTDSIAIGAAGDSTVIQNFRFISSVTAVVNAIIVEAGCTDFVIEDCVFENEATTVDEFIDAILVSGTASDRGIIRNNRFLGDPGANGGPKSSINFVDCDYLQVYGNEFSGDIGDAHIFNETTASNFITIRDNSILCGYIGDAATVLDTTPGISLVATTTGWITNNFIVTNVATPDLAIVAADCYLSGNTYNELQGGAFSDIGVGLVPGQTYTIVKVDGAVASNTDDPLFNIAGGPIEVVGFYGEVTTVLAGETSQVTMKATDAVSSTQLSLSTTVDIEDDADGTTYSFSSANPSVLTPVLGNQVLTDESPLWLIMPGTMELHSDVVQSGVISWYMMFRPLVPGVIVTLL